MRRFSWISVVVVGIAVLATTCRAGDFSTAPLTGAADSGISAGKTYTHAVRLYGGPTPVANVSIDGVTFAAGRAGNNQALHYDLAGTANIFGDCRQQIADGKWRP